MLVKYSGDILDVFCRNRGHLEYNKQGNTEGVSEKRRLKLDDAKEEGGEEEDQVVD